jgi:hypothetical protein
LFYRELLIVFIFYRDLIVICICFIEMYLFYRGLSVVYIFLSRAYRWLYLFYRDVIVVCIYYIECLSLFVFVLLRAYHCLYMLYRELIVCMCFLLVMSVKLITALEWIRFLYQYYVDVHGTQHQWNLEYNSSVIPKSYCEFVIICGILIFCESHGLLQNVKLGIQRICVTIYIYQ